MSMASRTVVSGLNLLFPVLAILFLASFRAKAQFITCQTNYWTSPYAFDANNCVNYLTGLGNQNCCQNDCSGPNACTTMCRSGTAAVDICGICGQCVPCQQAGNYIASIIQMCQQGPGDLVVGGYSYGFTNPTVNVKVYHS